MEMNSKTNEQRIRELEEQVRQLQGQNASSPTKSSKSNNSRTMKNPALFGLTLILIAIGAAYWGFSTGLEGHFSFQGTRYKANSCRSGAAFIPQFWGFVVRSKGKSDPRFEVQGNSAENAQIFVWTDSKTPLLYNRQTCKKLELNFEQNGSKVNNVIALSGSLNAECKNDTGQEFIADVQFRNCH